MDILQILNSASGIINLTFIVIALVVLQRTGVLPMLLKKNGNGDHKDEYIELGKRLDTLETNHFVHLNEKMDRLIANSEKQTLNSEKSNFILERLERKIFNGQQH